MSSSNLYYSEILKNSFLPSQLYCLEGKHAFHGHVLELPAHVFHNSETMFLVKTRMRRQV